MRNGVNPTNTLFISNEQTEMHHVSEVLGIQTGNWVGNKIEKKKKEKKKILISFCRSQLDIIL